MSDELNDPNSSLDASSTTAVVDSSQPTPNPVVLHLVNAMRLRGIRFTMPEGPVERLRIDPWAKVTEPERAALRVHRKAIKELMRSGRMPDVCAPPDAPSSVLLPAIDGEAVGIEPDSPPPARPPIDLDAVGIETYERLDGSIGYTHSLGDDYAEQVMSGVIPLEVALRNERRANQQLDELRCARSITIHTLVRK